MAPPPVEDPAQGTAPANEPAQPIGPPSELPYYQPAPSELLPPPPAAPAPPPKPQKPTPKFEFAPYFRSHYMLNDADFTYYEVGGQFLFGGSGTGVTLSYVSGIEGLLVGYQSPIFFGIPLYEGPVLLALTGPQAWAQFGIGDPGASLSVQTDPSAHFNFGGNPIGLEVAGCQGIPWFVQVGPQLSGMISFLPGGLDPLTWGTLGVDAKLGIMVF